ncbi:hypothetical protein [Spiroplasma clarkii]|nr:hypothetical protein [Spiroplasma clarkii]
MSEIIKIRICLTDGRTLNAELYPKLAPISVKNFVNLIKKIIFQA